MNFLPDLFNSFTSIPDKLLTMWNQFTYTSDSVVEAGTTFLNMLDVTDSKIVEMTNTAKAGNISGIPIYQTIGTFRLLMGNFAFYLLYMIIIFGCLMTITKIAMILYGLVTRMWTTISVSNTGLSFTSFKSLFTK